MKQIISLLLFTLILVLFAHTTSAAVVLNSSERIDFNVSNQRTGLVNGTGLDLNGNNVYNFFQTGQCSDYVRKINPDGTYECGSDDSGAGTQNLSQVLAHGNVANATIDMAENNITDADRIGIGTDTPRSPIHISKDEISPDFMTLNTNSSRDNIIAMQVADSDLWWSKPALDFRRARGNITNPQNVTDGDSLGIIHYGGYVGKWTGGETTAASIGVRVNGTFTDYVPGELRLATQDSSGNSNLMSLDAQGTLRLPGDVKATNGDMTITGSDNDGSISALEVNSEGIGQTMLLDGNEIDSNGVLYLQNNNGNGIRLGGPLNVNGNNVMGADVYDLDDRNGDGHTWREIELNPSGDRVIQQMGPSGWVADAIKIHNDTYNIEIPNGDLNISRADDGTPVKALVKNTGTGDADAHLDLKSSDIGESEIAFYHDGTLHWRQQVGSQSANKFVVEDGSATDAFRITSTHDIEIPNGNLNISNHRIEGFGGYVSLAYANDPLHVFNNTGHEMIYANNAGNVFIPNGYLDMQGSSVWKVDDIGFNQADAILYTDDSASGNLRVYDRANNQDVVRFNNGGNIEIPSGNLSVTSGRIQMDGGGFNDVVPNSCGGNHVTGSDFTLYAEDNTGGCGDDPYITHYVRTGSEDTTLEIGNPNDGGDNIRLDPGGNVVSYGSLDMADNDILDVNTVQANTLDDPEDSAILINDAAVLNGNHIQQVDDILFNGGGNSASAITLPDESGGSLAVTNQSGGSQPIMQWNKDRTTDVYDDIRMNGNWVRELNDISFNGGGNARSRLWVPNEAGADFGVYDNDGTGWITHYWDSGRVDIPNGNLNVSSNRITFDGGIKIGDSNTQTGLDSDIAIGPNAVADGSEGQAIGRDAYAGYQSTALGDEAYALDEGIAIGNSANATTTWAVSLGEWSKSYYQGTALGRDSEAGQYSVAVGEGANVPWPTNDAVAVGEGASVTGNNSVAIGEGTSADGRWATVVGRRAEGTTRDATAYGVSASANAFRSMALGGVSNASASYAVAIGYDAQAPNSNEATFGNLNGDELDVNVTGSATIHRAVDAGNVKLQSYTLDQDRSDDFDPDIDGSVWSRIYGEGGASTQCTTHNGNHLFFNQSGDRYAETYETEAGGGTISFDLYIANSSNGCNAAEAGEGVVLEYTTSHGTKWNTINSYSYDSYGFFTHIQESIPADAKTPHTEFRWRQKAHSGETYDVWAVDDVNIQTTSPHTLDRRAGIGRDTPKYALDINGSIRLHEFAIGEGAQAKDYYWGSIAIGRDAVSESYTASAIGSGAHADAGDSMAHGTSAFVNDSLSSAIGIYAESWGGNAIGTGAWVNDGGTAVGQYTSAEGGDSMALGKYAYAGAQDAVAIGHNALAENPQEATFGNLGGSKLNVNVTGNATIHGDFDVYGAKNFVQSVNATHSARYTSQESVEARAVIEGTSRMSNGTTAVSLPWHFAQVVSNTRPDLKIQVTPRGPASLYIVNRTQHQFWVESWQGQDTVTFDYRVTGIRSGYEDKQPVVDNLRRVRKHATNVSHDRSGPGNAAEK